MDKQDKRAAKRAANKEKYKKAAAEKRELTKVNTLTKEQRAANREAWLPSDSSKLPGKLSVPKRQLSKAIQSIVPPQDMVRQLWSMAQDGNIKAMELLMHYSAGKPSDDIKIEGKMLQVKTSLADMISFDDDNSISIDDEPTE